MEKKLYHVSWESVCNYIDFGGLGVIDLGLKNRMLLNKWLWRYANELDNTWRKIVVEIVGENKVRLLSKNGNNKKALTM